VRRILHGIQPVFRWLRWALGQQCLALPEFIAKAAELGYSAVMLAGKRPHLSPLDADDCLIDQLKSTLAGRRIRCAAIAGYTDLSPVLTAEMPNLEMQVAYIESLSRIAHALGAGVIRVFTAYESNRHNLYTLWTAVVAALREMCDRAADYQVTLAVQNHHDLAVHSDALIDLLADADRPNCKLGFDA
jgi:sugar phosphate isomerase/epimerase